MKYVNVAEGDEFPIGLNLYNQCERWKGICWFNGNWGVKVEWSPSWGVNICTPRDYYRKVGGWPGWYNYFRGKHVQTKSI